MHPRVRLTIMAAATIALVGLLAFALLSDPSGSAPGREAEGRFQGSIRPPAPPGDFALRDQDGRTARLSDQRGRVVVLTFMYTTCQDECPTVAQQIRGALDALGGDVPVLAVSVDPERDTPERARRFLAKHRMTGRMRFLLGDEARLQPVWRTYGVQPQEDDAEHNAYVLVLDRSGRARVGFPIGGLTPEGLAHDIRVLQAEPA